MCGGFAASAALGWDLVPYHLGRLAVYAGRGAFMGAVGSFVTAAGRLAGWQGLAASLAGALMMAWAVAYFRGRNLFLPVGFVRRRPGRPLLRVGGGLRAASRHRTAGGAVAAGGFLAGGDRAAPAAGGVVAAGEPRARVKSAARDALGGAKRGALRAAGLGALLGFMPCGLLATMEIKAAGTGAAGSGLLVMLTFGAGTLPGLTAWGAAAALGFRLRRGRLERLGAALVGGAGLLSLLRGLAETGLIPHVHPWLW